MGVWRRLGICTRTAVAEMTKEKNILPLKPSDYFSDEQWKALTAHLEPAARRLASLAKSSRIRVSSDTRWPLVRLKARRGLRLRLADLQLQRNFLDDHCEEWELQLQEIRSFWIFHYRLISVTKVMKITSQELADNNLIRDSVFPKMRAYLEI